MQHLLVLLPDRFWGSDLDIPAEGEHPSIERGAGGEENLCFKGAVSQVPGQHIFPKAVDDLLHQVACTAEGYLTGLPVVHLKHLAEVDLHIVIC